MSNESSSPVQVSFTPEFKRNLRKLAKKYRHIKNEGVLSYSLPSSSR